MPVLSPVIASSTRIVSEQSVKSEDWQGLYSFYPISSILQLSVIFAPNYVVDCFDFFTSFCMSRQFIRTDKEDERNEVACPGPWEEDNLRT